ncbi:unnamed protein product [Clonostachys rosea f. rosea IK726]|uniref:Uncharacterized protein n=1 Tax=Clonostachys rosea f. rosea IK726 TaxID=1349383 RepID=A0ACA9THD1_BIOOC|nr:unnamed protein product [Clonostachys rosea f. rosea IK726]
MSIAPLMYQIHSPELSEGTGDAGRFRKRMQSCHLELQRLLVKAAAAQSRHGKQRVEKGAPGVGVARKGHAYQGVSNICCVGAERHQRKMRVCVDWDT